MKIFGYEAEIAPSQTKVSREEIADLLDAMQDSLSTDGNLYSADLASDGPSTITVLLGVQVDDDAEWPVARELGEAALLAAFKAANIESPSVHTPRVTNVRQMAFAA